ncbi:MAG: PSD1 domain-containing protein, partial [Planctomycetaceae bacterium]|nr:PSD1 domain-containing protein [Planctomycetaceae bacterium]
MKTLLFGLLLFIIPVTIQVCRAQEADVSFSRDILPILSDRCFHCHGPDAAHREADLRLDVREEAIRSRDDHTAIVAGQPEESEIIRRISTDDADLQMPPPDSHRKPLTSSEIGLLKRWIAQGAVWGKHWSFERPAKIPLKDETLNPVDYFVLQQLHSQGLDLSPAASPMTLLRRLSFDLTGLPPTPDDVRAFETAGDSPQAVRTAVNRLLSSPHYGERMAMWWLDAARYSDTDGYQADATRTNWPWRDWVVDSFNHNMPFDRFTIEQFAGDLLPDATAEQQLATCFHRNHMTNGEGGRDPEESRVDYVIDRTNTVGTVWLGLTLGCCQCHSHKFDPISQHDYYSLTAFFNSIDEDGRAGGGARPFLKYRSPYADRAMHEAEDTVRERKQWEQQVLTSATREFDHWLKNQMSAVQNGFEPWHLLQISSLSSAEGTRLQVDSDGSVLADGPNPFQDDYRMVAESPLPRITGLRLEVLPEETAGGTTSRGRSGQFILTDVKLQLRKRGRTQLRDIEFDSAVASKERPAKGRAYGQIKDTLDDDPRNGWMLEEVDIRDAQTAVFALKEPLHIADDEELLFVMLHRSTDGDANIARFRVSVTNQPGQAVRSLQSMPLEELAQTAAVDVKSVSAGLRERLMQQFLSDHVEYQRVHSVLKQAERQLADCRKAAGELNVMVLSERAEMRNTHILTRGVWDAHGDKVTRGFPGVFFDENNVATERSSVTSPSAPLSRLELAQWIVSRDNPLTARVVVNHVWQMLFGNGLVRTPDDFGLQGERPTHPALLDWLAVDFMEHNWDLQHLIRLIVSSRTYQQSSMLTESLKERDPENRLLARQTRYRLPAWMLRDASLSYSGLLNPAIGGPPVMPYQPEGVWREIFMGRFTYEPSLGAAQYRRTLYAFWRRSSAPTFLFDSAQRRVCEVGRRQTNTPLQALTLLNDETGLEAARALARQALQVSQNPQEQIAWLMERVLQRSTTAIESNLLLEHFQQSKNVFEDNPGDAEQLLQVGQLRNSTGESPTDV